MIVDQRRFFLFSIHFGISFIIFLALMYLIFYKWYPYQLFFTSGGWHGTKIVFLVDMVLGPALTLILSAPGKEKKELIRDLFFCALIQIFALGYGIGLLIDTKPSYLSIHDGAIHAIRSEQIKNVPDKTVFDGHANTPPLVYSENINLYDLSIPEFKAKAKTVLEYGRKYGAPVHAVPATFDSLENRKAELKSLTTKSLEHIEQSQKYSETDLESVSKDGWYVLEMDGSFKNAYLAFDIDGKIHQSVCCH